MATLPEWMLQDLAATAATAATANHPRIRKRPACQERPACHEPVHKRPAKAIQ